MGVELGLRRVLNGCGFKYFCADFEIGVLLFTDMNLDVLYNWRRQFFGSPMFLLKVPNLSIFLLVSEFGETILLPLTPLTPGSCMIVVVGDVRETTVPSARVRNFRNNACQFQF